MFSVRSIYDERANGRIIWTNEEDKNKKVPTVEKDILVRFEWKQFQNDWLTCGASVGIVFVEF